MISLSLEGGLAPARLEGDRVRLAILRFWRDIAPQHATEIGFRQLNKIAKDFLERWESQHQFFLLGIR